MNLPNGHYLFNRKYQLTQIVGQGGFGITYKGIWYTEAKGQLGKINAEVPVCIKEYFFKDYCDRDKNSLEVLVHSETGKALFYKFKEKLIKEATILSEVHHKHIVNVLDVFEENNTAYIAMEYLEGCSLKYMLEKERVLPEAKVLKYIHQIGSALQFVHEKNILHLDVKPSNILIDKNDVARLIDFGVSKRYDLEEQETSTTMLTLSKGFASIEQYDNEGTQLFTPCPDIYSLGATMYNLLTGKIPTESILRATRSLQKPSELNPEISAKTEAVILKAMEIIPENRFQSVADMLAALDMPPEEKEGQINIHRESPSLSPEEITILQTKLYNKKTEADEEQTILNPAIPTKKRKSKKGIWVTLSISVLVLATSTVAFLTRTNGSPAVSQSIDEIELPVKEEERVLISSTVPDETPEEQNAVPEEEDNKYQETENRVEVPVVTEPIVRNDPPPATIRETNTTPERNTAEIDKQYAELMASGKTKMDNGDLDGAHTDLSKAKDLKITEEVIRLMIENNEKQEQRKIAERKSLYEVKMDFGQYIIVRKKSTGKYGAINNEAREYVPCKYLSVDKADVGRAFEREDHLFDVYNEAGSLLSEGVAFY